MLENYSSLQKNALTAMRVIGSAEAVSFLLLLLIAVPLKYVGHNESWVLILGPIHGGLFLLYLASAFASVWVMRWPWTYFVLAAFSSVFPFGPFIFEAWLNRRIKTEKTRAM